MEPGNSMPHLQGPSNNLYPEPNQSNYFTISLTSILILSSHLRLGLLKGLFPVGLLLECWKHSYLPGYIKLSFLYQCQLHSRRADERVQVRTTSCPQNGKLSLTAGEPQLGQQHEGVKRKREYYIPPGKDLKVYVMREENKVFTITLYFEESSIVQEHWSRQNLRKISRLSYRPLKYRVRGLVNFSSKCPRTWCQASYLSMGCLEREECW